MVAAMAAAEAVVELVAMAAVEEDVLRAAAGSAPRLPPRELPPREMPEVEVLEVELLEWEVLEVELPEVELLEGEVPPRWTGSCRRRRSRASTHGCRTRCGSHAALT